MKTTEIFAELLIIGVSASLALMSLLLASMPELRPLLSGINWTLLLPAIAVVYVLGIVVDRIADSLFDRIVRARRAGDSRFPAREQWRNAIETLFDEKSYVLSLFEYGRRRQRVLRSWVLVGVALAVTVPWSIPVMLGAIDAPAAGWTMSSACFVLAALCFWAWHGLVLAEESALIRLLEKH